MVTDRKSVEQKQEVHGEKTAKRKNMHVPKLVVALVLLVVLVPILVGVLEAVNKASEAIGGTVNQSPSSTPSSQSSASATPPAPTVVHVGSTISVKDQRDNPMNVTVVKVVDPITSGNTYIQPDSGKRFVAVQLKITNTGANAVDENAVNDSTVYDASSQSYSSQASLLDDTCPVFANDSVKLAPGASALGCVGFQLPIGTNLAKFQFTPSSGFSSSTGEWLVP